jgi:dihydroflavonol-4-reductase
VLPREKTKKTGENALFTRENEKMIHQILITGANGFLGSHLAKALSQAGKSALCLVRKGSDSSLLQGVHHTHIEGDVTDENSLERAMQGVHTVFHLAGIRRASSKNEFMKVNTEGTRNVARAMKNAGATRLVFCGSLAATGPSVGNRARLESDAFAPEEWYGESKAAAEQVAFSFSDSLEVTSIRPARILGPLDHENLTFFKLVQKGIVLKIMGPRRPLSMVDVDDVVAQLLLQSTSPKAVGEAFFCASTDSMSVEEMMRHIAGVLKVNAKTIVVPQVALRALGSLADVISNLTKKKLPLNRKLARQLLAPGWECSTQKAKTILGFEAKCSLEDSLVRSAQSYIDAGWLKA